MPRKEYAYFLDAITMVTVYFLTVHGEVVQFVVKMECFHQGAWHEILRYDCFHGAVHKDVLARSGAKKRIVRYEMLDAAGGLNAATADINENFESYMERWEHDQT